MDIGLNSNIKQIGSIGSGGRIYIEDYVMTFFKYMEEQNRGRSLVFILLGSVKKIDGEEVLFISGAVEGNETEKFGSINVFSAEDRDEIEKKRVLYFDGLETVGWCYIQPGYGDFLNTDHVTYHLENFKETFQVLYIIDPADESNSFFRREENSPQLKPVSGYIIYYDKNEEMREYLLAVKKEAPEEAKPKENLTENVDSFINSTLRRRRRKTKKISVKDLFSFENTKPAEDPEAESKKTPNLLGSLSFALLFVTLIIGGGLLKSNSRIEYLEKQVNSLGKNYIALRDDVTQSQEVFAESTPPEPETEAETQAEVPAVQSPESVPSYREYTVKSGDTLIYLSRYFYGSEDKVEDIMAANNMTEGDILIEGKTIKIPQ